MNDWQHQVQTTYDRVAAEYAMRIYDELAGKPLARRGAFVRSYAR